MEVWHWWIIAGVALFILEIFTPDFVAATIGVGCLAASLASALGAGAAWQVVALSAASLAGFIWMRPFFKKAMMKSGDPARLGATGLLGQTGVVTEAIGPDGPGRVKLGGESWKAAAKNGQALETGRKVTVEAIEGITLLVSPKTEV